MTTSHDITWFLLAHPWGGWGPMWGPGGGWMWLWGPFMMALWAAAIAAVIWLVVRSTRPRERSGTDRARQILAERYARGEIAGDEYSERLDQLR
ncbi:MAG TPA: SHOCT domain-containing protein [Chloroflexota bacterium]|nr:SHOCT domain-containing protein [Chloroflexota bacterium]